MNAADRLACELQRNDSQSVDFSFVQLDDNVKKKLVEQLRKHFLLHGMDVKELRKFVERNKLLESVVADKADVNGSSLREHLLMTHDVMGLLLEIPQPKNLAQWVKTKKVEEFVSKRLEPMKKLNVKRITSDKIENTQRMRNAVEFALENGWNENRIAMEMCLTLEDVRRLINSTR
ncbi:hypothetical protein EPN87_02860 [archaeon]|nr:MAG: hypothetical protein EPN87_02860 [archaeon]